MITQKLLIWAYIPKIAIILENNGKTSSSNITKYINTRYYFVKYCIEKYELSPEWCPAADMIGYFMTKPTQGAAFKIFWDTLVGVTEVQYPGPGKPPKDCEDQVSKYDQKANRNATYSHN